jgi:hypothetical protein
MTALRRALTLAASAALSLSLAAPATASFATSHQPAWACSPQDHAAAGAGASAEARGGSVDSRDLLRDKGTSQVANDTPKAAKNRAPSDFAVTVQVYWHVVTDGAAGAVTNAQIQSQIVAINRGFSGGEGGTPTGFQFALAGVTRTNNPVLVPVAIRRRRARHEAGAEAGRDSALDIYSTSGGALLGYAYLPEITNTAQAYLDGIVIDWRTMPGVSTEYAGVSDEGDTLTHEAGHWLNLEHTFSGSATRTATSSATRRPRSRRPPDAPRARTPARLRGSTRFTITWTTRTTRASRKFTPGQVQRMRDAWLFYRAS